jgi:alkylation response protein AidB-like acyl-CoA dehydrogenase
MLNHYDLNASAQDVSDRAAIVADTVVATHAQDVDVHARFPTESVAALRDAGLLGLCVGREHGGLAQDMRAFAAVTEHLGRACGSTAMIYVMHIAATQTIGASPTFSRKGDVLADVAGGQHLATLAFSEAGSRSHFWAPMSQLATANGGFVTDARKSWVTSANHADSYVASARSVGSSSPLDSTLYLTRRSDHVTVSGTFNGLGLRGNDSAPVVLEAAPIGRDEVLTEPGDGAKTMLAVVLPWFSIGSAAMANGLCAAALDATAQHLQQAGFEHTGEKLRDLPVLRARLADMSVRTEASLALLARTLRELEHPSEVTPLFVLQARLAALQAAVDVTDLAMKTCGGAAFSRQLPVERLFRDARAGWVMAPTVDQLQDFVGRALTGLPLF